MEKLTRGGNIDSKVLNKNLTELQTLLSQAFTYNSQLRGRQAILDVALQGALTALADYSDRIVPDLTKYNTEFDATGADASEHMWAGNPPHLLSQLLFNTAPTTATWISNTAISNNSLILDVDKFYSKISTIPNDYNEQIPSAGTIVKIDGVEDVTWGWTLLSPDMLWAKTSASNTMNIVVTIPPGLSPNVNHIGVQTLFPKKNTYQVKYKSIGGTINLLKDTQGNTTHSVSQDFYFPNAKFGSEIILELTSTLQDSDGDYIFGLSGIVAREDFFQPTGYMIKELNLHDLSDDLTARYLHSVYYSGSLQAVSRLSDAIRIQVGSDLIDNKDGTKNLSNVVYDTNVHPLSGLGTYAINLSAATYYVKVTLNTVNGITPTLEGLLFEYSNEV